VRQRLLNLLGVAIVGFWAVMALPVSAATDSSDDGSAIVGLLQKFCVAGHADTAAVMALADSEHWTPMPDNLKANLAAQFHDGFQGRMLSDRGATLVLVTGEAVGLEPLHAHVCLVIQRPGEEDAAVSAVARWLSIESMQVDGMRVWAFGAAADGHRIPGPTDEASLDAKAKREPVEIVFAGPTKEFSMLAYGVTIPDHK
jgi:hypothetical protein